MAEKRKMKAVKAWAVVDKRTGEAWFSTTYATRKFAREVLGNAHQNYRIARVEIREVK